MDADRRFSIADFRSPGSMPLDAFHPVVAAWFAGRFAAPTEPQVRGWPEILAGRHTLIAAPTGSGKTLAAFLAAIDRLLRQALEAGELPDETQVVYVSPLKALSSDVQRNLERPLEEIQAAAREAGFAPPPIRALLRTGDPPSAARQKMVRRPPHILVTTPESLYLLLTSPRGRETLHTVRTVIVDEIHALARDKRGSHLVLSLERLEALCPSPPVRIGLSATQKPLDEMARFLVGTRRVDETGRPDCAIVDVGHQRQLDLAVEVPPSDLQAVCTNEQWDEVYGRLCELISSHRSTLVFVNTRRMAERVAHRLSEALGAGHVASHHGSLSKELRLAAERKLQTGELRAIVATASLELGIDVGYIDLVCQIGSPRSIATALQRIGRAGHSLGAVPKGRLFPLSRDELLECLALVRAVRQGRLDRVEIPLQARDILAQQIVAAVSAEEWSEDSLYALARRAWPYRDLPRTEFDALLEMLAEGIGRRHGAWLHRDRVNGRVRARRGARIAAATSGGAIPEVADYRVVTEEGTLVGSVNEDFAIESLAGDVFLLGNSSWRIRHVRGGEVVVADAHGAPATIPFWLGEGPGRTFELSQEVSALREEVARRCAGLPRVEDPFSREPQASAPDAHSLLRDDCLAGESAARQAAEYVRAQLAAVGLVPTTRRILFERFFDETGGMQLVIHSPLGARINRAWGLALRKRFCRSFDFELQASADDDGIVLSLGPQHSFPLEQMFRLVPAAAAEETLVQALLAVPMFQIRWRWNVTRALAVLRQRGGKKVPPPLQRFRADDLLTAVFPQQTACFEHRPADLPLPDHPLVRQTVHDCLHEAMDLDRWLDVLRAAEAGQIELVGRDTREPSPFSHEILNANPYAFLDDAPLEERRARAVATRRTFTAETLGDLSWLDPQAIATVRRDAWPTVRDADELHDALLLLAALPEAEGEPWLNWMDELLAAGRATRLVRRGSPTLWVAAERLHLVAAALPGAVPSPVLDLPGALRQVAAPSEGVAALVRGRMEVAGPTNAEQVASELGLDATAVALALEALEAEGAVLRGQFAEVRTPNSERRSENSPSFDLRTSHVELSAPPQWCNRRLLARIHRLTLDAARRAVQPAAPEDYLRFLAAWQHVESAAHLTTRHGLVEVLAQLAGFEAPAGAWERDLLPARLAEYDPGWLDELMLSGEAAWGRLVPPRGEEDVPHGAGFSRAARIALVPRADLAWLLPLDRGRPQDRARGDARAAFAVLAEHGALFFHDLAAASGLLPAQLEAALGELAALGAVTADGFTPVRALVREDRQQARALRRRIRQRALGADGQAVGDGVAVGTRAQNSWPRNATEGVPYSSAPDRRRGSAYSRGGRWSRFPVVALPVDAPTRAERWARLLLRRYGVVFRDLLARETAAPPWREVAGVLRRMEAQGSLRGGRFVTGVAGEQFALAEAVTELRRVRDEGDTGRFVVVNACDPLNLTGIVGAGPRVPAVATHAVALLDGRLVASRQADGVVRHAALPADVAEPLLAALRMDAAARQHRAVALA
jgi:ATP-dependent Lhr-like helicase